MENSSLQYFGIISIIDINNVNVHIDVKNDDTKESIFLHAENVKFVHYPDCQQLIIWLPEYGRLYDTIALKDIDKNAIVWVKTISDILNGSVQLIFDTLPIPDGNFEISIVKSDGLVHHINFCKFPEGQHTIKPKTEPESIPETRNEPIVYRDGFGNTLPNEDLILRDRIIEKTISKITRRVDYISHGRDGEVIYIEGEKRISFYMEMGAYECVFFVNIPTEKNWESYTKFPLEEREDIINFVAEHTQRDQASSCYFKISGNEIMYYKK